MHNVIYTVLTDHIISVGETASLRRTKVYHLLSYQFQSRHYYTEVYKHIHMWCINVLLNE